MHVQSASAAALQNRFELLIPPRSRAATQRVALDVESIGYLVPPSEFTGRVHSVFAQACNITHQGRLLTLGASGSGDGPTMLRLAPGATHDLRNLFDVGAVVRCRQGNAQTGRTQLRLMHAGVWRPAPLGRLLPGRRIDTHLRNARLRLAQHRGAHTSVIDGEGACVVSALRDACRALDSEQVVRCAARLVGWGEGLTPAGDDFLIGLIAGLDALVDGDEHRRALRDALATALDALTQRTTPVAAHYLRLAAGGHYSEPLLRLRDAWLCEDNGDVVDAALRNALAVGATSGADTASGLRAALQAWLPAPLSVDAA